MPSLCALRSVRWCLIAVFSWVMLAGCAGMFNQQDLHVSFVGIEPLDSQGLELRMNVKLRIQNPNETPINFDGVSLELEVNGDTLASGVSNQTGTVPRYGETVIGVPVTIPAFSAARQAYALVTRTSSGDVPFVMHGKLSGGTFGSTRFTDKGTLPMPGFGGTSQ